jgi:hypothetical protein
LNRPARLTPGAENSSRTQKLTRGKKSNDKPRRQNLRGNSFNLQPP